LVATVGLIAAIAVKSGRRRRLDNLKAAAETLAQLTETQHQNAVRSCMDKQSAALSRQLDPQQTWVVLTVGVIVCSVVVLGFSLGKDLDPTALGDFSTLVPAVVVLLLGTIVGAGSSAWQIFTTRKSDRIAGERFGRQRAEAAEETERA
jgi:hypothetical protein